MFQHGVPNFKHPNGMIVLFEKLLGKNCDIFFQISTEIHFIDRLNLTFYSLLYNKHVTFVHVKITLRLYYVERTMTRRAAYYINYNTSSIVIFKYVFYIYLSFRECYLSVKCFLLFYLCVLLQLYLLLA